MSATDLSEDTRHRVVGRTHMERTGWRWRYVRWAAFAAYAVALLVFIKLVGVPTDRLGIYGGILVFLSIAVLGHGWAVEALRSAAPDAEVGIVLDSWPVHPASESPGDAAAAFAADGVSNRWFFDPVLRGSYPADVLERFADAAPPILPGDLGLAESPDVAPAPSGPTAVEAAAKARRPNSA